MCVNTGEQAYACDLGPKNPMILTPCPYDPITMQAYACDLGPKNPKRAEQALLSIVDIVEGADRSTTVYGSREKLQNIDQTRIKAVHHLGCLYTAEGIHHLSETMPVHRRGYTPLF